MALFLSFRYQAVGGPTRTEPVLWESNSSFAVKSLDISRIASLSLGRDILFAVHGYNNSQQEAVCSLSRLEAALSLPPSALFLGILWPGDLGIRRRQLSAGKAHRGGHRARPGAFLQPQVRGRCEPLLRKP